MSEDGKGKNCQGIAVVGLIRDGNGKILMQRRGDGKYAAANGKWEFPGGAVDYGESPIYALVREVLEETGCDVSIGRMLPTVLSRIWEDTDGSSKHVVVLCYECWYMGGVPRLETGVTTEIRWCTSLEIAKLDALDGVPVLMRAAGL